MTRTVLICLIVVAVVRVDAQTAPTVADAMRDWIGVWQTEDTYHPVSGQPSVERGVRTCALVMHDAYLQCETVVTAGARSRTYRFLANYNRTTARFEMLSLWSNVPHKAVQKLTPDATRQRWTIENVAVIGDDEPMSRHWSELVFESRDRIVWTGRRVTDATPDPAAAPVSFREVWTRTKQESEVSPALRRPILVHMARRNSGEAPIESRLSQSLMKLAKHYQLRSRDRVCRYDITVSQCYALEAIVEHDGVPVTELARDLGLDKSTTSRVADSLVVRRLATVEDARGDARVRRLVATKAGRTLAMRIKKEIRAEHRALFGTFSASDLAACDRVITALVAHTSAASCTETPTAA